MNDEKKDPAWPLTVKIGETYTAALMNRKAFQKTLESRTPWIVDPRTGRVLPWPQSPQLKHLAEGPGCFILELEDKASSYPYGEAPPPKVNPDDRSKMADKPNLEPPLAGDIPSRLSDLILERKKTLPEASYTSHLFQSGAEKIRKKVGEEAVELLLAQNPKDIVYEAADLIYHLQVLLIASDLEWSDVTQELVRRDCELEPSDKKNQGNFRLSGKRKIIEATSQ